MDKTKPFAHELSRREFLSTATTAAALIAFGLKFDLTRADAAAAKGGRRVGISDEAYASARARAKMLSAQMTLKEKISHVADQAPEIARLKIPKYNYYADEALHGISWVSQVTSFPVPLALASAWNPELAHQVYTAVSDEGRAHYNADLHGLSYYSPVTLNLHRDPRWGRSHEAPGEDPCLAATLAVQVVRGMQGDHADYLKTTACSKHFICNNTDNDREATSATVDSRSFWEYDTRAFRATVTHSDVFTFMSAYNAVNGVPCSADHRLLTDILRHQWGFRGYVTSDCDAIKDIFDPHHYAPDLPTAASMAMKAGCDLNCWGGVYVDHLQEAVDKGLVSEAEVTEAVTRLLTVRALLGTLDPVSTGPYASITLANLPWKDHQELALESARQSLVLLKNHGDFLPLSPTKVKKIAVIGPLADICHLGGYSGSPSIQISPLKGIADRLGLPVPVKYISGGSFSALHGTITTQTSPIGTTQLAFIKSGDWAKFDKIDLTGKTEVRVSVESASEGGTMEVHLDKVDGPLAATFTVGNTGGWEKLKDMSAPLTGTSGVHDLFVVFHGTTDNYLMNLERMTLLPLPTGVPTADRYVAYSSGCGVTGNRDDAAFAEAVDMARGADVVVMVCGVDGSVNSEGHDRDTIGLTGAQPELIKAVYAVNPNVVLVLSTNNSVNVTWEQSNLPAILCAICAGQMQGTAIAEALFGDYAPGGKLTCTWYRSLDQLPDMHDYDIHKGRTYQYFEGDPLYPFGYGLSYTSFRIDGLKAQGKALKQGESVKFSVRVTNTGRRAGAEVVQLYIVPPTSPVKRPRRQLAGFQRVFLKPGEEKTITFDLPYTAQPFWYWSEVDKRFVCQPGTATVEIGNSSAHTPLSATLRLAPATRALAQPDAIETVAVTSSIS